MIDPEARAKWLEANGLYEEDGVLHHTSDRDNPTKPQTRALFPRLLDALYAFWEEWHDG